MTGHPEPDACQAIRQMSQEQLIQSQIDTIARNQTQWKEVYDDFRRFGLDSEEKKIVDRFFLAIGRPLVFPEDLKSWATALVENHNGGSGQPRDREATQRFREQYAEMRAALLAHPAFQPHRRRLLDQEIQNDLFSAREAYAQGEVFDRKALLQRIVELDRDFDASVQYLLKNVFTFMHFAQFTPQELMDFTTQLSSSRNETTQRIAKERRVLLGYTRMPMDLPLTSVEGHRFNIRDYRGKIVLVNVWPVG